MGRVVNFTLRPLYPWEGDPLLIIEVAEWNPGFVWTSAEQLAPPGFDPRTVRPVAGRSTDWDIIVALFSCYGSGNCGGWENEDDDGGNDDSNGDRGKDEKITRRMRDMSWGQSALGEGV